MSNILSADKNGISIAASLIAHGKVIVIPTETVYGLVADATNSGAIDKIYQIKGRPKDMALQALVSNIEEAEKLGVFDQKFRKVAEKYWPGPLTAIVRQKPGNEIANLVAPGKDTIGIRIPNHKIVLKLIQLTGKPLASTSANKSGEKGAVTASEAYRALKDDVELILDGGKSEFALASTVIDFSNDEIKMLRLGSISEAEIRMTYEGKKR